MAKRKGKQKGNKKSSRKLSIEERRRRYVQIAKVAMENQGEGE